MSTVPPLRPRLTRPPGGFPKFSSLFAIIQLLHALNAIPIGRLVARYCSNKIHSTSFLRACEWKLDAVAEDSGLSLAELRGADIETWMCVKPYGAQEISEDLRGCIKCYEGDFHCALYQCKFVEACPVHGLPLIECCPQCGRSRPYSVSAIKRQQHPFACACLNGEWNLMMSTRRRQEWSAEMDLQLMEYLSWITAARTTLSLAAPPSSILRRDGSMAIAHSCGRPLERLATTCAALGSPLHLPKGVQVHGAVKTVLVTVEDSPIRVEVAGDGAGGRAINEQFESPGTFPHEFWTNVDHSREAALSLAKAFTKRTLSTVQTFTETHHRFCRAIQDKLRMFSEDRVADIVCTPLAALELLKKRWNDDQFIESIFNAYFGMLKGAIEDKLQRHDAATAQFVASELVSHQLIAEITEVARIAQRPERERRMAIMRLSLEAQPLSSPSFTLACSRRDLRFTTACAVLTEVCWQDAWARGSFVSEDHFELVVQRSLQVEERIDQVKALVNELRGHRA